MTRIKVRLNGPYLVEGDDVTVVDSSGREYVVPSRPFVLCRCGHSARKPFCDGTHRAVGFRAAENATPPDDGSGD